MSARLFASNNNNNYKLCKKGVQRYINCLSSKEDMELRLLEIESELIFFYYLMD